MLVATSPVTAKESETIATLLSDKKLQSNGLAFYNKAIALLTGMGFEQSDIFSDWNSKEDNKSDYLRSYLSEMIQGQNVSQCAIAIDDEPDTIVQESPISDLEWILALPEPAIVTYPIPTGYISGNKKEILQLSETLYSDGIQQFSAEMFQMALSMNLLTRIETVKKAEIVKEPKKQKAVRIYLDANGEPTTDPNEAALSNLDTHYGLRPMATMTQQEIAEYLFTHAEISLEQFKAIANIKAPRQSIKDKLANNSDRANTNYQNDYFVAKNYTELQSIKAKSSLHLIAHFLLSEEGYSPKNLEKYNVYAIDNGFDPIKDIKAASYKLIDFKRKGYEIVTLPNGNKSIKLPMDAQSIKLA